MNVKNFIFQLFSTFFFLFLFFPVPGNLFALTLERVAILEVSSSKSSIIIDRGNAFGIKKGDKARFLYRSSVGKREIVEVAEGLAVKVNRENSFWYLKGVRSDGPLKKNGRLIFALLKKLGAGKASPRMKTKKIILPESEKEAVYLFNNRDGFPDSLRKREKDHEVSEGELVKRANVSGRDHDGEIVFFDKWQLQDYGEEDLLQTERKYSVDEISEVAAMEEQKDSRQRKVADSIIDSVLEKADRIVEETEHFHASYSREDEAVSNLYKDIRETRKGRKEVVDYRALEKIKRDPELWSTDMDDDQLRRFVVGSGIVEERLRQKEALESKYGDEILIRALSSINNGTDESDPYYQGPDLGFYLGYEFHLGRTSSALRFFSVELGAGSATNHYYDGSNANVVSKEIIYSGGLNWYMVGNPAQLRKYLWYMGVLLKMGSSQVSSVYSSETEYQVSSLPTLQLGMKYRFSAGDEIRDVVKLGVGMNFLLTYERIFLASEELNPDINGSFQTNKLGFSLGMSLYF